MADVMGWEQIVSQEMGLVIITGSDCVHCVELEATLCEKPINVPTCWVKKENAAELFAQFPLFAASIDVLPFVGIFSLGQGKAVVRAATHERITEALDRL